MTRKEGVTENGGNDKKAGMTEKAGMMGDLVVCSCLSFLRKRELMLQFGVLTFVFSVIPMKVGAIVRFSVVTGFVLTRHSHENGNPFFRNQMPKIRSSFKVY